MKAQQRMPTFEERMRTAVKEHLLTGTKQSLSEVQHLLDEMARRQVMQFRQRIEKIKNSTR